MNYMCTPFPTSYSLIRALLTAPILSGKTASRILSLYQPDVFDRIENLSQIEHIKLSILN